MAKIFIIRVLDNNHSIDEIINDCMRRQNRKDEESKFLKTELSVLRKYLHGKVDDIEMLKFRSYDGTLDSDLILSDNEKGNVVIVEHKNESLIPLLIESKKIRSFITMNKGGKKVFVLF